jgi:hypothetical protein
MGMFSTFWVDFHLAREEYKKKYKATTNVKEKKLNKTILWEVGCFIR